MCFKVLWFKYTHNKGKLRYADVKIYNLSVSYTNIAFGNIESARVQYGFAEIDIGPFGAGEHKKTLRRSVVGLCRGVLTED